VTIGCLGGFDNIGLFGSVPAHPDILEYASVEENGLLLDHTDLVPEPLYIQILHVHSLEIYSTGSRIIESLNE